MIRSLPYPKLYAGLPATRKAGYSLVCREDRRKHIPIPSVAKNPDVFIGLGLEEGFG